MRGLVIVVSACSGSIDNPPAIDASPVEVDAPPVTPPGAKLEVSFSTAPRGGQFAPNNCVAVWVEQGGTFVRTIERQCIVRRQYLVSWFGKAGIEDNDAVSGATRANHATPVALTWDLHEAGVEIPDGAYTLRIELADGNSTNQNQNHQATFSFAKGPAPQLQSGLTMAGFSNVSIRFTPAE